MVTLPNPKISPLSLTRERLQLHYASRLLASVAHTVLPHADDDSHSNLGLDSPGKALVTHWLNNSGKALSLELRDLRLSWTLRGETRTSFDLVGKTMADAYSWLNESRTSGSDEIVERQFPDFPPHPLADGAAFVTGDPGRRVQLSRYFALAQSIQDRLAIELNDGSMRRIWPHHYDLGMMVPLATPDNSIGLGMSPGDSSYDEPYFYVSRYPNPAVESLPDWSGEGHWHTDGFVSLVLTATEWQAAGEDQEGTVWRFIDEAVRVAKSF